MTATRKNGTSSARGKRRVRYAVVGLGYISQIALLPALANASKNSELVALISDDPLKLKKLGKQYGVQHTYSYDQYEDCLKSGEIDAVYSRVRLRVLNLTRLSRLISHVIEGLILVGETR